MRLSRFVLLLLASLALAATAGSARPAEQTSQHPALHGGEFFPIGVWYSGGKARAPMLERIDATSAERWGRDLDAIKSAGFDMVKTWIDWATAEPAPEKFDFSNLELLLKLAQQRGLRVVVQLYLDSAPDWVGQRYPEGKFVDRSGAVIESQAAPGFCVDHPGVRSEIIKFLSEMSRRANQYQALYGWDVWSEPHVINWAEFPYLSNPEFCYCPNSQRRFRAWLQQKYGMLARLNAAWYRNFSDWNQVSPPRASTILSYTDYLDWRAFITDKLAGDLRTRVDAIRSADTAHFITSHAAVPGLFTSPTDGYGEPDDFLMAASADYFGTSIYPKHAASQKPWPWWQLSAALDFSRSAGHSFDKGFWIGELQAGQGVTGMRIAEPVLAHDLEKWMWMMVAHGARQVAIYAWYPMSSGYESNGYGLINLDGTLTDRARVAGRVAQAIERNARDLLAAEPEPAQVAVLYDRLSYMVGGAQPSLSKLGNATRDSLMGLHRVFNDAHIAIDFIHPRDVTSGRLQQYRIVFLPFPVMLSRDVADGLTRYIRNGGTVVSEARLAWNDERGFSSDVVPGFDLAEVFGARETVIRPVETAKLNVAASPALPGFSAESVSGEAFEEELEPGGSAQVLAHFADGAPAMVQNNYGKGKAVLIGSFLAVAYQRHQDAAIQRLLLAFARSAGVQSDVTVKASDAGLVEVRRLLGPDAQFLFVLNHADTPQPTEIAIAKANVNHAEDLTANVGVPISASNASATLRKTLAPDEVWVVKLTK
jgi:beta-galactosidase